ncbi:MAG: CoA-binding protein [Chloroflexi bacterium]|nr:CoA-binding protein [Chloroflexota bacterium]MQC16827.1 CoA-binding protein [Chloroflexota bacterium]
MDRPTELMRDSRVIAVVGVSTQRERPANEIAEYLIEQGYEVYLVNETEAGIEMLGRVIYPSVASLPVTVDIVDIFRRPDAVPPHVEDAIRAGASVVWMQLGIVNEDAAARAREAGLEVVMDRCTKIEHARLRLPGA